MFAFKILRKQLKTVVYTVCRCNLFCAAFSLIQQRAFLVQGLHGIGIIYKNAYRLLLACIGRIFTGNIWPGKCQYQKNKASNREARINRSFKFRREACCSCISFKNCTLLKYTF